MEPIQGSSLLLTPSLTEKTSVSKAESSFADLLTSMVSETDQQQKNADLAMQQLHTGGEKNLHEAMISMEKADISMRYMIQVRNKAIEAYQEIMRMQV